MDSINIGTYYGLPRIGDHIENFSCQTTFGPINFHEWKKGAWCILFSHPADFTPVCSTELTQFAKENDFFSKKNTKLIALSIDSIHSHLAWVENLKKIFGVSLSYPIIADPKAMIANQFGMIHPNESETVTVRGLFVIDPNNKVRATIFYPLNVGRNTSEVKRLITALQTSDEAKIACPVNWQEGEKVVVHPPKSIAEIDQHQTKDLERLDFYLCKRPI